MALRAHARGGADQLVYEQAPVPVPLRPIISQSFPLRDGRRAFESGTPGRPPGKTVLIVR